MTATTRCREHGEQRVFSCHDCNRLRAFDIGAEIVDTMIGPGATAVGTRDEQAEHIAELLIDNLLTRIEELERTNQSLEHYFTLLREAAWARQPAEGREVPTPDGGFMKQLNGKQTSGLVELIEDALDDGIISTEKAILDYALRNRKKFLRYGELTPSQIKENLRMFLGKMESGGRIGIAYYRRKT